MTPDECEQRIDDLFHAASELPPDERTAYLDRECAGDPPEIRQEVEALLRARPLGKLVPMPGMESLSRSRPADPMIGRQIGA